MKGLLAIIIVVFIAPVYVCAGNSVDFSKACDHPRLYLHTGEEAAVFSMLEANPIVRKFHQRILNYCDETLSQPVSIRQMEGKRLLAVSRTVLKRVFYLSYAFRMTGNREYFKRAEAEMLAACSFSDWNPGHFLDVGEMCWGLALGYDWLYGELSAESRETIREAIVNKGLRAAGNGSMWFYRSRNNWNQVCNGGLVCAALAICEDEPEIAREIVDNALSSIGLVLENYAPDGAYPEGYQYWNYGTTYQVLLNDALETAIGTDEGLNESLGFLNTARFVQFMTAPSGNCFNFYDANPTAYSNIVQFWFAQKNDDPSLLYLEMENLKNPSLVFGEYEEDRFLPLLPILASRVDLSRVRAPKQNQWYNAGVNPLYIYRSGWDSPDDVYLGVKGGIASFSHAHMDSGSFIYENAGVRWALDLGMQNYYSLESKGVDLWNMTQGSQRWQVFRIGSTSHNTLTVAGAEHNVNGKAEIVKVISGRNRHGAVVNLSETLAPYVDSALRTVTAVGSWELCVCDEITAGISDVPMRWTMCTPADVEMIAPRSFSLKKNGKEMRVEVISSCEVSLFVKDNAPVHEYDYPNEGTCRLGFDFVVPAGEKCTAMVKMVLKR